MVLTFFTLVALTFASEDLACVTAGVLIAQGTVPGSVAVTACAVGIFIGDLGLWAAGRAAAALAADMPLVWRLLTPERLHRSRSWLETHAGRAIVASRFMPGTRLPLYVTAGIVRMSPMRFATWTLVASVIWTPVVVLASARAGSVAPDGFGVASTIVGAGAAVMVLGRTARRVVSSAREGRLRARIARAIRWEFWPSWLFYAPVAVWVLFLSLRHRGLTTITASNPGIADGGFVGESKFDILQSLPADWSIPSVRVRLTASRDSTADALSQIASRGWTWPLVAKPDVGQRGVGVRLIRSEQHLSEYLSASSGAVLLQPFHPGPFEAGVFYARLPGQPSGRILSMTDKHFPVVIGDGRSTIRQLIDANARFRLQRSLFLERHRHIADTILPRGARFQLALAGNHAQGTSFYDGAHLWTSRLERRIDEIAQRIPGFYIGRFDVRYTDVDEFKAGRDLAIVELNGAAAESTHIYDPGTSLIAAYRTLFRQWSLVFAIGAENRRRGALPTSFRRFVGLVVAHLADRSPLLISD